MRDARLAAIVPALVALLASPFSALAGPAATQVPEPSSMGIFAIGAGAAYLLHRYLTK